MTRLSVVIPAYNEERVIGDSIARAATYLVKWGDAELIVVDDGSRDRTRQIVRELGQQFPFVRLVENDRNRGKGYSIKHGILDQLAPAVTHARQMRHRFESDLMSDPRNERHRLRARAAARAVGH